MQRKPITAAQIKKIHTVKSALGMDDGTYRAMIKGRYGVESSKHLDARQAASLIGSLEDKVVAAKGSAIGTLNNLRDRVGMATQPQLQKIEAMWSEVSRVAPEYRAKALRQFVNRIAHVSDLRFLDSAGAGTVINALKKMRERAVQPSRHHGSGQLPGPAIQNHV